jgi:hypothetical protein
MEAPALGTAESEGDAPSAAWWGGLFLAAGIALLAVYFPALQGPFVSDDFGYLTSPYTESLSVESLLRMFDPSGDARHYTGNYAPVHLLLHALERAAFGTSPLGFHLVNVAVHALNAMLLVALLMGSGASRNAALVGGVFFALHPANVEAVAWISQLKSTAALAFSLLALLCLRDRPVLGVLAFGLALLTKATAAFALPAAIAFAWTESDKRRARRAWFGVASWCAIFALFSIPQATSFARMGEVEVAAFEDPTVQVRTVAAIGARYLVMAATGTGVSAFAEPAPVDSWTNPWLLAALPLGLALASCAVVAGIRRTPDAGWWFAAAAAFLPVSQIFPFLIPFADRYLYFILPGLIGGVVCLSAGFPWVGRALGVAALAASVGFAWSSHERAALWVSEEALLVDAALHYPDGGTAHYLRARRAAAQGDVESSVASLRLAAERGLDRFDTLRRDPGFAPVRHSAQFRDLVREMAGRWIQRARVGEDSTQPELLAVARAHRVREEWCAADRALAQAVDREGPLPDEVAAERASLLAQKPRPCDGPQGGDHR